jgi:hypothetical protein
MIVSVPFSVTTTISAVLVGAGDSDNISQANANANAPPPGFATLQAGNNTILVPPSTYTCTLVFLKPPSGSVNVKTVKGVSGDTGLANWTSQPLVIPVTAGGSFVITSTGVESVECVWG